MNGILRDMIFVLFLIFWAHILLDIPFSEYKARVLFASILAFVGVNYLITKYNP